MNDRFRFRVWDNRENWYIQFRASSDKEPFTYILADADGSGNTIDSVFNSGWHNPDDCVIEQCTGLRDKTGRLIFEGDVVKFVTGKVGVVKWSSSRSGYYVVIKGEKIPQQLHGSQEIVGNIHEVTR